MQTFKELAEQTGESNDSVHSHDYYEIVWVTKGMGTMSIDLNEHAIENNMVFAIRPNQAHRFVIDPEMDGFVFSFTENFFNMGEVEFDISCQSSVYHLFHECQPLHIQQEIEKELMDVSLKMMGEYLHEYSFRTLLLKRYFKIFLILLTRQLEEVVENVGLTREKELVKRFMELLDKNYREEKTVSGYATLLAVTANYLNRNVKKHTGYSAGHHIRQRVILEAKRMARFSDSGMKEIAYELGFFDSAHFSKFFKTVSGTNFTNFKREAPNVSAGNSFHRA